jgi:PAS domain S-box-containing protein
VRQTVADPSGAWRYGFAVVAVVVAAGVRLAFNPLLEVQGPYMPFYFAVIIAALFGGRGPGLVATATSGLWMQWLFLKPAYCLPVTIQTANWGLALFLLLSAVIALLIGNLRESFRVRARTEDTLRRQAHLIDLSHDAVITMDSHRRIITWNKGAEEMYGWSERDAIGKVLHELLQTFGGISIPAMDKILHQEGRWEGELSRMARDGHRLIVDSRQVLFRSRTGSPACILAISRDITRRKEMEEDLRESEEQFRTLADAIPNLSGMAYPDGTLFWLNQRWSDYTGLTLEQSEGAGWLSAIDREASPGAVERWEHSVATGEPLESVFAVRGADGVSRPFLCRAVPLRDSAGRVVRWFGAMTDISEQRRTEEALRKAHGELQAIMDAMPTALLISRDPECRFVLGNRRTYQVLHESPGSNLAELGVEDEQSPAYRLIENGMEIPRREGPLEKAAATGQSTYNRELELLLPDASRANIVANAVPLLDSEGRPAGAVGIFWDITERKRNEERLRESEERLRLAQQVARLGTFEWDLQTGLDRWTPELEALYGLAPGGFGGTVQAWEELVHPADKTEAVRRVQGALDTGVTCDAEYRVIWPNGSVRWLFGRARMLKDDSGNPKRLIGVNMDITERKQAEERLRQIQKLESIGLLAGGIAHDFNNLLTVIIGNADFARTKYPSIEELPPIIAASERAAQLTSQLLAYSGKGQFISQPVNLSDLVSRSTPLLSASISKRLNLVFRLSQEDLVIKADPSQIEQILMNLVINAAEAIPSQTDGRIEIVTGPAVVSPEMAGLQAPAFDVRPGDFVLLEVTDNGSGMDETTMTQIFDPFFSTKFTGRGLGLASVQGILRSCNGFIDVRSSPGVGSTFRVFLPASSEQPAAAVPVGARPGASRLRDHRTTTILVVDDEEMVRSMARTVLQGEGYEVLEVNNARGALDLLARAATLPALVLLDLTMPEMGGAELVPILNRDYPGLRVIVTSDYSEEDTRRDLPPGAVADFLEKPYTITTLAKKVEGTLNSGGPDENTRTAA